jgi:hypothetical protein
MQTEKYVTLKITLIISEKSNKTEKKVFNYGV